MSSPEQEQIKTKYLALGLPESLIDAMIAEANIEYETDIGVEQFNRYANVKVFVDDVDLLEGEFYLYIIQRANTIFYGEGTLSAEWDFAQVPCTEIVFQVFKMFVGETLTIHGYGYSIVTVSKEMSVIVTIGAIGDGDTVFPDWEYVIINIDDGILVVGETCGVSDAGQQTESPKPSESMVKVNT